MTTNNVTITTDPQVTVVGDNSAVTAVVPISQSPPPLPLATALASATDWNTLITAGIFYSATGDNLNTPSALNGDAFFYLQVYSYKLSTYAAQTAIGINTGNVYSRTLIAGTWGAWAQDPYLNASNQLPAVDGSQLINMPARSVSCGRLSYTNATTITFIPYKGNTIQINGLLYQIPSGGVTITNSGLAGSTLYYVYAYINSGTITLEISATGHVSSSAAGNVGTEIKSGDNTRTLVGMLYTTGSGQFSLTFVLSYFNRVPFGYINGGDGTGWALPGGFSEVNSNARCPFLCWVDQMVQITIYGSYTNNTAAVAIQFAIMVDVAAVGVTHAINGDGTGSVRDLGSLTYYSSQNEGYHYASIAGSVGAGLGTLYGFQVTVAVI